MRNGDGSPYPRAPAAALLTAALLCLATRLSRTYPFGPVTRNVVDLGQQYLPYHAYWRALLLLGDRHGDAFLNWNSGFGANFLGDIGTYLSSPFDLLVVFFPADRVELLRCTSSPPSRSPPRRPRWRCCSCGCGPVRGRSPPSSAPPTRSPAGPSTTVPPSRCGSTVSSPSPCSAWSASGPVPAVVPSSEPLVVALAWIANFYTAYMATLGAAVVLAVRLLTAEETAGARQRLAGALRAARSVLIGIGLAAPLVVVVFLATKVADPTPETTFAPAPWTDVLARFLPATASVASPALFIGTPALALALTLPFNRAVAPRVRAGWTAAILLVTLSLQWEPTHLLWHAGASPNGIPYRQTFVLCGLLLIGAWFSAARGVPRPAALLAGTALLGALAWAARGSVDIDRWTFPAFGAAALLALVAVLLALGAQRKSTARVLPVLAVVLLVAAQGGRGAAVTGKRIEEQQRAKVYLVAPGRPLARHRRRRGGPRGRLAPPPHGPRRGPRGGNDVLLVGGQGADYYSSLTADVTSRTLASLGFGHYAKGRHPVTLDNPVADALFSIGTRLRSKPTEPACGRTPRPVPP
ncbi:hypothetical protein STANM309S_05952 [Streptomyces tanashiensis]